MLKQAWFWMLTIVTVTNLGASSVTAAHNDPFHEAELLKRYACQLHTELDAHGVDPATDRYVCRLETAIAELIEKLSCPHDVGAIDCALRETAVWLERTTVGVETNYRLHTCLEIVRHLEATHRSLTYTSQAIECWLSHGASPGPAGFFGGVAHPALTGGVPFGSGGYTAGYGSRSSHAPSPAISSPFSNGSIGGHRNGGHAVNTPQGRGLPPPAPPAWAGSHRDFSTPSVPYGLEASRSTGGGEIGRAIIGALLSELSRR